MCSIHGPLRFACADHVRIVIDAELRVQSSVRKLQSLHWHGTLSASGVARRSLLLVPCLNCAVKNSHTTSFKWKKVQWFGAVGDLL